MSETKEKYFGAWSCWDEMAVDLGMQSLPDSDFPTDEQVIVAGYNQDAYEGSSTVIFERDGKLYEDSSGHCSCNGLDWCGGSEISWEYIEKRIADGHFPGLCSEAIDALKARALDRITGQDLLNEVAQDFALLDPLG